MAAPTAVTIPSRLATAHVPFTWTAGTTSATLIDWMPGDILMFWNTSVDTGYTTTVISDTKRSRDTVTITAQSIAFGIFQVAPRFGPQDDDTLSVTVANVAVKVAQLSTKAQPA